MTQQQSTPDKDFKARFIALIKDLGENASKDPETIWLIGSLAGSMLEDASQSNWSELKASLSREGYDQLLNAFKAQGNELASSGNHKAAYAIQTLAISVIAPTMAKDEHIAAGNQLLDKMVDDAINMYRQNPATGNTPN
jgi:hypothetical protein